MYGTHIHVHVNTPQEDCGCKKEKPIVPDNEGWTASEPVQEKLREVAEGMVAAGILANEVEGHPAEPDENKIKELIDDVLNWLLKGPCSPTYCLKLCTGDCAMSNCFTACVSKNGHPCCGG